MKYKVIKMHRSEYPNPIVISKGDRLMIGEKSDDHEAWEGWYFCQTLKGIQGWVPQQIIQWISEDQGEALDDYSAIEMDVDEGQVLTATKTLNGWVWCQNSDSKAQGWVPLENLIQI
jgi:hypothetical protein